MSGGYQKVADAELVSKTRWRVTSVGALLLLVMLLTIDFFINRTVTFTIEDVIRRLTITAALGTLSTYAARQAAKHEEAERYSRRMELELASFDLYLTGIPDAASIRKQFTDKFFGNEFKISEDKENDLPKLTRAMSEVAASFQQILSKKKDE